MIGRVIDVTDFRNAFLEHHFNPLFESQGEHRGSYIPSRRNAKHNNSHKQSILDLVNFLVNYMF